MIKIGETAGRRAIRPRHAPIGLIAIVLIGLLFAVSRRAQPPPAIIYTTVVGRIPSSQSGSLLVPTMALDTHTRQVFVTIANDGTLTTLNVDTGAVVRTVALSPDPVIPRTSLSLAEDVRTSHIFVADTGGNIEMLDARDGRLLRTIFVPAPAPLFLVEDARHTRVFVVGRQGTTIVVFDIDARDDRLSHQTSISPTDNTWELTSAVLDPSAGHLSISTGDMGTGVVYVLNESTHALVRTIRIGSPQRYPRVSAVDRSTGHLLLTTSPHDFLLLVNGRTGRIAGMAAVHSSPWALAVDARRGHTYAVGMCSCITMLETRTGATLRTIQLDVRPSAIVVDETTGYVLVADPGGLEEVQTPDMLSWMPSAIRRLVPGLLAAQPAQSRIVPPTVTLLNPNAF